MHQHLEFEWHLDELQLAEMRSWDFNKNTGSELFDGGNWGLICAPNGEDLESKGSVALGLCLYHLPHGVNVIIVDVELVCIETDAQWKDQIVYRLNTKWKPWPANVMKTESLKDLKHLTLTVSLRIDHLAYEHVDEEQIDLIDRTEWPNFGIIMP